MSVVAQSLKWRLAGAGLEQAYNKEELRKHCWKPYLWHGTLATSAADGVKGGLELRAGTAAVC